MMKSGVFLLIFVQVIYMLVLDITNYVRRYSGRCGTG
jgi:hypothetical protein